tara:strand:+ start:334 stop:528 length:195 start_codon:yes stop_codon:yes gene_type:complete
MSERKKREDQQNCNDLRGFRNKHDSRIFVEPYDFLHVFSGLDFSRLSLDKYLDRFEKSRSQNKE